ncbi:hypothetical protein QYE76_016961 [Lolium multiflorum]|uniref:Uncharacterized protein n=1 Tax=Lolium multiflorum TaxID=4521 RepID=A0AAD8VDC9_LOLMU|nr:hypothetical protein QYE76_016961 [Lolium multiflorum]
MPTGRWRRPPSAHRYADGIWSCADGCWPSAFKRFPVVIVGGGTDGQIESVRRYARSIGLLFQVVDDVLDVTRTSEQLGKTAGKDQAADKATYPKLLGVEQAQAYMAELLAMAEAELQGFDAERAAPLHHLASQMFDLGNDDNASTSSSSGGGGGKGTIASLSCTSNKGKEELDHSWFYCRN